MLRAEFTHDIARRWLSDVRRAVSFGMAVVLDCSDELQRQVDAAMNDSETRAALTRLEWRLRNCSTTGCGLSSFAVEDNSA